MNELANQVLLWTTYFAIVAVIAGPVLARLIRNLIQIHKQRKHMKSIPGPLLGVVYPETKKRKK
jgi:hypothetical protein